ncbi:MULTISPECIES: Sec-independent protein translocase subunit TatA/TatB [Flavobacterium]|uniref:Sec-independent protein translocase protein TatA n=1 Tax=Flavobacterium suzhouense TaxID=1529638 RepID=A0ABW5NU29_9FLAO|nr:twin-arginine translocase TatA/TatE family subunit [Flavobacterium sp. AG291]RDI07979.1 sec-independent protein translocase protein TatA [Flavobacterium sp. AG291]
MGKFGLTEWILVIAVILLLFGGKKIPELMKGLGTGIKEFKNAAKDGAEETSAPKKQASQDENKL